MSKIITAATAQRIRENIGNYGLTAAAKDAAAVFKAANYPYLLCGGYAVQNYGYMRSTEDVDTVVKRMSTGRQLLISSGKFAAVRGTERRVKHIATGVQVDMLPGGETDSPGALPFVDPEEEAGQTKFGLDFVTLPQLITLKLMAYRARDKADVVELIKVNELDRELAEELPVSLRNKYITQWEEAQSELGLPGHY